MKRVSEYLLNLHNLQEVYLPPDAELLRIVVQPEGIIVLQAMVPVSGSLKRCLVRFVETGQVIDDLGPLKYIDTFSIGQGVTLHAFEVLS